MEVMAEKGCSGEWCCPLSDVSHAMSVWLRPWRTLLCTALLLASAESFAQPPQSAAVGEINVSNVGGMILRLALSTGRSGGQAGGPLFDHDRLFVITPFPHSALALDVARTDASVLWRYSPRANGVASGFAIPDVTTEGAVLLADRLFLNTFDGHTIALDAATGKVLWDVAIAEVERGETLLVAPLATDDRIFIGSNGSDFGVRGWMAALDAASGRMLWKRYNTGPDAEVGIGEDFASPYLPRRRGSRRSELASRYIGSRAAAGSPIHRLYDAASGLLFYATGHPAPWNAEQRPGQQLFHLRPVCPRRRHRRRALVRADQSARSLWAGCRRLTDRGRPATGKAAIGRC